MSISKQLYQMQGLDLDIETSEQSMCQINGQLGDIRVVAKAKSELALEEQNLEGLKRQQHSAEWEIDDLISKLGAAEEKIYSGRIVNPKELANLQQEIETLKSRRNQLEAGAIEVMDMVEIATTSVMEKSGNLERLETEWHCQQQQLATELEYLKSTLSELKQTRQLLLNGFSTEVVEFYNKLNKQKGTAVAKVEHGSCRGCGISLTTATLQRAKGDNLVQCTNCGRILFLS
jgi:predicted  nucleic acid-binding Zn-ribbon protein